MLVKNIYYILHKKCIENQNKIIYDDKIEMEKVHSKYRVDYKIDKRELKNCTSLQSSSFNYICHFCKTKLNLCEEELKIYYITVDICQPFLDSP